MRFGFGARLMLGLGVLWVPFQHLVLLSTVEIANKELTTRRSLTPCRTEAWIVVAIVLYGQICTLM